MTSNRGQHTKRGGITHGDADSADACTGSGTRERERGRDGVETEGTRGESLREWVKEREWSGVVLQKVRIIPEASCHTSQQLIPGGTERANCVCFFLFICYTRTLDQRRISCWSTVQSFDMEGRGRVKQL